MTLPLDPSSVELAARLKTEVRSCSVVETRPLSTNLHAVTLRGSASILTGVPGNDVMIRVEKEPGSFVRRRYSVRAVNPEQDEFTLWISTSHEGAGSAWVKRARPGDAVDVVGPRGKIHLDPMADWHLFVGDISGLAAFYRLAESIEPPGRAIFVVEIDDPSDAVTATFDEGLGVTGIFIDRCGRAKNDPAGLLSGLAAFALPPDDGHAYLFGEFSVVKVVQSALIDRGLSLAQMHRKPFWRAGLANADHGEPVKTES